MGPWMNVPGTMRPWCTMHGAERFPCCQPGMPPMGAGGMATVYPDIYYKLQPHIMRACDMMDDYGGMMFTQDMVERMSDRVYDDVMRMEPDMADYAREYEMNPMPDSSGEKMMQPDPNEFGRDEFGLDEFGRRFMFRRRSPFRDLITILFLHELFRRRRRRRR